MSEYNDLPVSQQPLSAQEREAALIHLSAFLAWAGSPGDWGSQSKLGVLTKYLHNLRAEIFMAPAAAKAAGQGA